MKSRVLLTGMSGAGKSTVGHLVAELLGWQFVDMDDEIERRAGRSIPDIFAQDGEAAFREVEFELLTELLAEPRLVVATGGGAVCSERARAAVSTSGDTFSVWMHAPAEDLLARVLGHDDPGRTTHRPMLAGKDQLAKMRQLLADRAEAYGAADVTIPVHGRDASRTATDIAELVQLANGGSSEVRLQTSNADSLILVGQGVAETLREVISGRWPKAQAVWIGVDANVASAQEALLTAIARSLPVPVHVHHIESGESSKSLAGYASVLDWMLAGGVQRGDVAIALGGGVVGDLMGFVAATVLRGIGLIQVPTTLLSMVDSSVGGKTGINHPVGKNLIGAFYQPPVVLADTSLLTSLPERDFRSGFGEIIKHGIIQGSTPGGEPGFLRDVLHLNASNLLARQDPLLSWVIRQNISLKASVVEADEREASLRQILNFGHTIGHGIEAAGYQLLHGEAIAVGMVAAATIAVERGDVPAALRDRLAATISAFGLPITANADAATVVEKMRSDKKKSAGKQNWVLPDEGGGVFVTSDVTDNQIDIALQRVLIQPARA